MKIFNFGAGQIRTLLLTAALLVCAAHEAAAQHHDHLHPQPTPAAAPQQTPQPSPTLTPVPAGARAEGCEGPRIHPLTL